MDTRRRRADDFTDSLHSFRQTVDGEDSQTVSQTYSEDSLDTNTTRNKQYKNDKCSLPKHNVHHRSSIILAGNLANEQFVSSSSSYHTAEESSNVVYSDKGKSLKSTLNISDKTSYMDIPDLNKCINLFHNEHLKRKFDIREEYSSVSSGLPENKDKENINPCHVSKGRTLEVQRNLIDTHSCAILSSSLKHTAVPNKQIRRSKSCTTLYENTRDTNYNIKARPFFLTPIKPPTEATTKMDQKEVKTIVSSFSTLSLIESSASSNKVDNPQSTEENERYTSISSESTKDELNPAELRTFLQSLAGQPAEPSKTTAAQEQMLRRLSVTFYDSPRNFTERLLTIIEESVIHNDSSMPMQFPEISLCRLTAELRKMCKFIENETEPEWPSSLGISMSACARDEIREPGSDFSRKSLGASSSPSKKLFLVASPRTPRCNINSPKKVYRCTPKSIGQITPVVHSANTPTYDSTSVFESLEEYCNSLYPDEYKTPSTEGSRLQSSSQNMSGILRAYDDQVASLQNSPDIRDIHEQLRNAARTSIATSGLASQRDTVPEMKTLCCRLLTKEECDKKKSVSPRSRRSKSYEMIEPDDLENTLMYEIAKKRQRCLDTARMMMEIDANSDSAEALQTGSSSVVVTEMNSSTSSDAKLMETLMTCKRYQDYLEEHKPLLNLIQRVESCRSNSPYNKKGRDSCLVRRKQGNKVDVATLRIPRSSVTCKGRKSPSPARYPTSKKLTTMSKPKLFVTPGKPATSKTACKKKRTYIRDMAVDPVQEEKSNVSSHAKSVYRHMGLNYDTVISPVGMYIRGTDTHLMKNLRPKTDEMLLTPRKTRTPSSATSKSKMRFKLSPKQTKQTSTAVENRNVPDKFMHPKVLYELPSHVRTIKETEDRKVGNRVNKLLSSMQDKVVIRHEGRTKTVQKDCLDQPEIRYDPVEESVHVEQTARKTCFSRVQKNY